MKSLVRIKTSIPLILITFACFGLLSRLQAVVPAPDGCYPNFTTAEGCDALNFLTTGAGNTGLGWRSLFLDTTGSFNTGVGGGALALNNGDSNTAVGAAALLLNTTGSLNTAVGTDALVFSDTGSDNTAVGAFALFNNSEGDDNTAVGFGALVTNLTGDGNTAIGSVALSNNTIGLNNTAVGFDALENNIEGSENTAIGAGALFSNTGNSNTAIGDGALQNNSTGGANIALGVAAGGALTTGNSNIDIGNNGMADESGTIRIGSQFQTRTFVAGIRGVTTGINDAITVVIDSAGQLGTMSSSRRFKKEIKPMDESSEALHALKPVTFHYNNDAANIPQFGLIAEEVAEVNPDLVVRDENGEIYTVRYDAINAMLLNEFLKEHRAFVEEQQKVAQQQKEIEALKAELREQRALIHKVSDKLELKKSTPQVVAHN